MKSAARSRGKAGRAALRLVRGDDEYHVEKKAVELASLFMEELGAASIEKIDGQAETVDGALAAIGKCEEALCTQGLFDSSRVLWLAGADFLGLNQIGKSARVAAAVARLSETIAGSAGPDAAVVVSAPAVAARSPLLRVFKDRGEILEFMLPPPWRRGREAESFAGTLLAQAGIKASRGDIAMLIGAIGADYRRIEQEIGKLCVFLHPKKTLSGGEWREVVSGASDAAVWDLTDAAGERDLPKAMHMLRSLLFQHDKVDPVVIADVMSRHFRFLAVLKDLAGNNLLATDSRGNAQLREMPRAWAEKLDVVYGETGKKHPARMSPYLLGKQARQAMNFTAAEMEDALRLARETRWRVVDSAVPEQIALELMLLKICRRRG